MILQFRLKKNNENDYSQKLLLSVSIFPCLLISSDDNGWHPVWNKSATYRISCFEMAYLYIGVYSGKHLIGENYLPLRSLRFGYRSVQLFDSNLKPLVAGRVLVHLICLDPVEK